MKDDDGQPASVADEQRDCRDTVDLYRSLVESLHEHAVFGLSPDGRIITWNAGAQHLFGYLEPEVLGHAFTCLFTPEDVEGDAPRRELDDARQGRRTNHERWHVRKDGTRFYALHALAPIAATASGASGYAVLIADLTDYFHAREALRESEERLRLLIESVPDCAIFSLAGDGSIVSWNSAARRALGYAEHEIVGKPFAQLFAPEDVANGVPDIMLRKAKELGSVDEERWFVRKDGSRFLGSEKIGRLNSATVPGAAGFVHVAQDMTARNQVTDEIRRQALLDGLTELPNRNAFLDHVHRAIAAMRRRPSTLFGVLFIDLDHFKGVNDTHGHDVADRLLKIIARRLEQCARAEDIVARIGGDEFAVLLNGIANITDANDAADRIVAEVRKPAPVGVCNVTATVSVGIAIGSARYERPEDVLRDADAAMYAAKAGGRGRSRVFNLESSGGAREKSDLETDLRHAVARHELRVAYQPVVRFADGVVTGFEALVRWQHPRRGLLQPPEFILKAEETDLVVSIDRWVLQSACRMLAAWRRRFARPELAISVNFSTKDFSDPDVFEDLRSVLRATALPPACLHLEITESAIMERSERTSERLAAICALGVELQIDDFGVGYSSLAALGHMPVHALKIDRSFIATQASRNGGVLVRTITNLAHNLGLVAIAEGIETPGQRDALKAAGCDYGQGFLFSEPLTPEAAEAFLAATGPWTRE